MSETCQVCGSQMSEKTTDLPFKVSDRSIVIVKSLPVFECGNCREYLIADPVMEKVEAVLEKSDSSAELEVVQYAA